MTAPPEQSGPAGPPPNGGRRPATEPETGRPSASDRSASDPEAPLGGGDPGFDPRSWGGFDPEADPDGPRCVELCPICRAADVLRKTGTPQVRGGLHELQREALLTARALIDQYVERLDARERQRGRVEQIPID